MLLGDEITSEGLKKELAAAEKALAKNEKKRRRIQDTDGGQFVSPRDRLLLLGDTVEGLALARDAAVWAKDRKNLQEDIMVDARQCVALGELLLLHSADVQAESDNGGGMFDTLLKEEYEPLQRFVRQGLIINLRKLLRDVGYPSPDSCSRLLTQGYDDGATNTVSSCCYWLTMLQTVQMKFQSRLSVSDTASPWDAIVELCRPLVERVCYHFVEQSEDRVSSTRIDRLPEWLFTYLRENFFEGDPWDYVSSLPWIQDAPYLFLLEAVSLADFVLTDRRFFQSPSIVGPRSNPLFLSSAVNQLLQFDSYTRELLPPASSSQALPGLTQRFVASNDELWNWWVEREREAAMSTMFETELTLRTESGTAPRAELFCSLIHSTRSKASLLDNPVSYLGRVAVPVCTQFLDAIHVAATDLRNLLSQRTLPNDENLRKSMEEWVELVNGTHLASTLLLQGDTEPYGLVLSMGVPAHGDHDLERVGRSMERLRDVLVDECATTLVETVLADRAKMASYIMRCSNLLACTDPVTSQEPTLSADLQDAARVFFVVMWALKSKPIAEPREEYATMAIRTNIMDRLADQLLEVALDAHGMTPDIYLPGAIAFATDVNLLFGELSGTPLTSRLLDVARFMRMESQPMRALRSAFYELSRNSTRMEGAVPLLSYSNFSSDGTVLGQAVSMLRAKGHAWMQLEDAISILNRRKDMFL